MVPSRAFESGRAAMRPRAAQRERLELLNMGNQSIDDGWDELIWLWLKGCLFGGVAVLGYQVRDYLLERLGKVAPAEKRPFNDAWSRNAVLVAVADIANTAKHFQLRDRNNWPRIARTKKVRHGKTSVGELYVNARGEFIVKRQTGVPTYVVEVEGGKRFDLYSFMHEVLEHWKAELKAHGIRTRRQPATTLHGT
jgi:hypothetical protein